MLCKLVLINLDLRPCSSNPKCAARSGCTAPVPTDVGAASSTRLSLVGPPLTAMFSLRPQLNSQLAHLACLAWPGHHRAAASPACLPARPQAAHCLRNIRARRTAPSHLSAAPLAPIWQITSTHLSPRARIQLAPHLLAVQFISKAMNRAMER